MSTQQKDKRTKEQILHLLDKTIEKEERLVEKIKTLEAELADCRKKAEDPRHEMTEEAMPSSKVSFRIDYYRTSEESPMRGIIEHLPSRQKQAFEGDNQEAIGQFIALFLSEEPGEPNTKKPASDKKEEVRHRFSQILAKQAHLESTAFVEKKTMHEARKETTSQQHLPPLEVHEAHRESRLFKRLKSQAEAEIHAQVRTQKREVSPPRSTGRTSPLMRRLLKGIR